MEKRKYGRTSEKLSVIGFGGILVKDEDPDSASCIVKEAIDRGINYFDVAPSYGNAEERLGPALEPYRDSVFLACKTLKRIRKEVEEELYRSLKHLRTEYFDLYQLHAVNTLGEINTIMGEDGAIDALVEAREQGLIKYLGFSSHSEEAALKLLDSFEFDSILFPLNWVCWYQERFGIKVVKKTREKGIAILALKALAKRKLREKEERKWLKCWYMPVENLEEASLASRFTLSLPVTAAVSPGHAELLWWACNAAEEFKLLTREEELELFVRSEGLEPIFPK